MSKIIQVFLYYIVAVSSSRTVFADTLEQHVLARLSSAHSPAQVEEIRGFFEKLRIARTACQIQLRSKMVPSECYQVLQLERKMGLHKTPHEKARFIVRLDDLCFKAVAKLNIENIVVKDISPKCREKVTQARKIQAYRDNNGSVIEMN